jgi:hypothetical protein
MSCISKDSNGKCELAGAEDKKLYNVDDDGKCLADDEGDCSFFTDDKDLEQEMDIDADESEGDVSEDSEDNRERLLDD